MLTVKQQETLDYIKGYFSANNKAPTQKEIAGFFNVSRKAIFDRLYWMEEKGAITTVRARWRNIRLV